jgi:hypothetical protein
MGSFGFILHLATLFPPQEGKIFAADASILDQDHPAVFHFLWVKSKLIHIVS